MKRFIGLLVMLIAVNTVGFATGDEGKENTTESWYVVEDKDEFGDPNGEMYAVCINEDGEFSNSATSGSNLTTVAFLHKDRMYLTLWEYDKYKANFINTNYNKLYVKDNNGEKHIIKVFQSSQIVIIKEKRKFVELLLNNKEPLKCYFIERISYGSTPSRYSFTIATEGFSKVHNELK